MDTPFRVSFWGVRGSYPMPGADTARVGGNTACVEVEAGGQLIIFDAGTGIIKLGQSLNQRSQDAQRPLQASLFFTHVHHDHTQGFPFFFPARSARHEVYIFGPRTLHEDLEEALSKAMLPPVFPLALEDFSAIRQVRNIQEGETVLMGGELKEPQVLNVFRDDLQLGQHTARVSVLKSYAHPKGGVFIYRVDAGGKPPPGAKSAATARRWARISSLLSRNRNVSMTQ